MPAGDASRRSGAAHRLHPPQLRHRDTLHATAEQPWLSLVAPRRMILRMSLNSLFCPPERLPPRFCPPASRRRIPRFAKVPVVLISIDTMRATACPRTGTPRSARPSLIAFSRRRAVRECVHALSHDPPGAHHHAHRPAPPGARVRNNAGFVFDGQAHVSLPRLLKQYGYATGATVSSYVLRYETGLGRSSTTTRIPSRRRRESKACTTGTRDKTEAFAKEWIAKHTASRSFSSSTSTPHLPYQPLEPFRSEYGVTYTRWLPRPRYRGSFLDDLRKLGVYDRAVVIGRRPWRGARRSRRGAALDPALPGGAPRAAAAQAAWGAQRWRRIAVPCSSPTSFPP